MTRTILNSKTFQTNKLENDYHLTKCMHKRQKESLLHQVTIISSQAQFPHSGVHISCPSVKNQKASKLNITELMHHDKSKLLNIRCME